jgi:hypothetical protein
MARFNIEYNVELNKEKILYTFEVNTVPKLYVENKILSLNNNALKI